jgi:hypothetical protein
MITIDKKEFRTDKKGILHIQEKVEANTCKTNVSPQLMFRQGYSGYSGDADPPCPVMLTPHKDYGSENLND